MLHRSYKAYSSKTNIIYIVSTNQLVLLYFLPFFFSGLHFLKDRRSVVQTRRYEIVCQSFPFCEWVDSLIALLLVSLQVFHNRITDLLLNSYIADFFSRRCCQNCYTRYVAERSKVLRWPSTKKKCMCWQKDARLRSNRSIESSDRTHGSPLSRHPLFIQCFPWAFIPAT